MTDAPERIWAGETGVWLTDEPSPSWDRPVEYVRADLYEQVKRERDESARDWREALDRMHQRAMTAERLAGARVVTDELRGRINMARGHLSNIEHHGNAEANGVLVIRNVLSELEAALAEPAGEAEPVAWQWKRYPQDDLWYAVPDGASVEFARLGYTMRPLYTTPPDASAIRGAATHRHMKRGTEYVLIGIGKMQAEDWHEIDLIFDAENNRVDEIKGPSVDMREVAIYRSVDDGSLWVRPREEFEDGRFEALAGRSER